MDSLITSTIPQINTNLLVISADDRNMLQGVSFWGKINGIFNIIVGILTIISGIPALILFGLGLIYFGIGSVNIIVGVKLLSASRKAKLTSQSNSQSDFNSSVIGTLGDIRTLWMINGIVYLITTILAIMSVVFFILFFASLGSSLTDFNGGLSR